MVWEQNQIGNNTLHAFGEVVTLIIHGPSTIKSHNWDLERLASFPKLTQLEIRNRGLIYFANCSWSQWPGPQGLRQVHQGTYPGVSWFQGILSYLQGSWCTGLNLPLPPSAEGGLFSFYSWSLCIYCPGHHDSLLFSWRMKFFRWPDLVFNDTIVFAFLFQSHLLDMASLRFLSP